MAKKLQMCGTEAEMREVAGKICRNYLHGAWKTVDPSEMFFVKLTGGLSNFLYLVGLPDTVRTPKMTPVTDEELDLEDKVMRRSNSFTLEEPRKVLLRIYGQVHGERAMDAIVTESVIFTLLSERKLGPKLYGVFSGGRIEEYIPARPLLTKELSDPALSMKIAEKMAAIHSMAVPLSKDPDWIWKNCYKWLKTVKEERLKNVKGKTDDEESVIKLFKRLDFDQELTWLKKVLATVNSPVVFCHNDMQEGNILLFENSAPADTEFPSTPPYNSSLKDLPNFEDANTSDSITSRISDSGEPRMVFIDFEYCAYNYRGFDIANHFQEWAYDYSNPDHPYYYENLDDLPTLEQREIFIKEYLKAYQANGSDDKSQQPPTLEEINQLLSEVEAFELASNMLWTLWSCVNASKSQITFGYWEYARSRLENYQRLKSNLIKKSNSSGQKRKIEEVDI